MSTEEANSLYKCTVRDFHALHKWDAGGTPSQAMELQDMGVDGQGSRETGGSAADRIFFMKYLSYNKKYQIRAWYKCIFRNSLTWMHRKFSSISTSPLKLCTRHTSVRQMML
jgi:hypothetical protein